MPHVEIIGYSATAPGASLTAATVIPNTSSGASLVIKNAKSKASVIHMTAFNQAAGMHQLLAQSLHDTTRNFRIGVAAAELDPQLPPGNIIQPEPQEQLSLSIAGSAVAGDVEQGALWVYYRDLPGVRAEMIDSAELRKRTETETTVIATLTGAATGVTGVELINAESDLLKANREYAVLGASVSTNCLAVLMSGPDFGNVYIGVPGAAGLNNWTRNFFQWMSLQYGEALIPVFNSGNKNSMNLAFIQNENNVSPVVTWYLALLKK